MLGSDNNGNQSSVKDFISNRMPCEFLDNQDQGFLALLLLVALFIRHV